MWYGLQMKTKKIWWKGKIGYGDIISPICYAHNQAEINKQNVELNFYFEHEEGTKFKEDDSETINDRIDFITENMLVEHDFKVTVNQTYNYVFPTNHVGYNDNPRSLHNLAFSKYKWKEGDTIYLITPRKNKKQFAEYAPQKAWKDEGHWDDITNDLKLKGIPWEEIHYQTPLKEVCENLSTSRFVIGYHGGSSQVARWLGVPMWIRSQRREWSEEIFPWNKKRKSESLKQFKKVLDEREKYLRRV